MNKLTDEQLETLRIVAERFIEIVKRAWEILKELAKKTAHLFSVHAPALEAAANKEKARHKFGPIIYTKGHNFKTQVQLNKPKFIQARSRL